jgi:hypothetical protein
MRYRDRVQMRVDLQWAVERRLLAAMANWTARSAPSSGQPEPLIIQTRRGVQSGTIRIDVSELPLSGDTSLQGGKRYLFTAHSLINGEERKMQRSLFLDEDPSW